MKIAVIGAGVVGLTTSLQLKTHWQNAEITVVTDRTENLTSHAAAGIFRVGSSFFGPDEYLTRQWIKTSYEFYDDLSKSRDAGEAGVVSITGYIFGDSNDINNEYMKAILPQYRNVTQFDFNVAAEKTIKHGILMTTLLTQPNMYLNWALRNLEENGVRIKKEKVNRFEDFASNYDLVFNCTGLGSKDLCQDSHLIPVRGQVEKVYAPWLKMFYYDSNSTYIIPGADNLVTLGGSRDFESWDLDVCTHQASLIRDRCENLIPSIKKSKHKKYVVGLRPYRNGSVRVDYEMITNYSGKKATIIHNYGHGGYGVCMAPGTSKYAITLANDLFRSSPKF